MHGSLIIENKTTKKQDQIPIYFVLVAGFPGVAPKVFLTNPLKKGSKNPFIVGTNEVLN